MPARVVKKLVVMFHMVRFTIVSLKVIIEMEDFTEAIVPTNITFLPYKLMRINASSLVYY